VRHPKRVLAVWLALFVCGVAATANLGDLLANRFSVPGSDAERGLELLTEHFGERSDGAFTLVVRGPVRDAAFARRAQSAARRAARELRDGKAGPFVPGSRTVGLVQITTTLENQDAANRTPAMRRAIGEIEGGERWLTGFPAINEDIQPKFSEDLQRGELIAIPIALAVMAFMFGTVGALLIPLGFALITIPVTLGLVWVFAHWLDMAVYVQNIVTLIGLAIAVDYSMLVVFRFREELERDPDGALERTMATAGRATVFSGATVAVGLALLVFMPLPFMRSMGVGGLLVPLVSIAASVTLLPALLGLMGHRINSLRFIPRRILDRRARGEAGMWTRLAHSIMRRPVPYLVGAAAVMLLLAFPVTRMELTGGDERGMESLGLESTDGMVVLKDAVGAGARAPHQIVIDSGRRGGAWTPELAAAQRRLVARLRGDREVIDRTIQAPALARSRRTARAANLVSADGRYLQVRAAGRSETGLPQATELVERIRDRHVPAARLPGEPLLTGAAAFNTDFVDTAYGAFPWLVLAVLVASYLLLLRAFRSVVLPLKAVFMNLLSVGATYGVLVLVFQDGLGSGLGFIETPQIDAWVPIFLFAMLFGLSMDYEVFLLSRMREEWDRCHDNERAVARGLEQTGRIITAAALIMVAAFAGFSAGSFVALQEFGVGLSAAILLDATLVRAILVPATMKLLGNWNWYLPARLGRIMRAR